MYCECHCLDCSTFLLFTASHPSDAVLDKLVYRHGKASHLLYDMVVINPHLLLEVISASRTFEHTLI